MKKNILTLQDFTTEGLENLLEYALAIKKKRKQPKLENQTIFTLMLTPSIHTKLSLDTLTTMLKARNLTLQCHQRDSSYLEWVNSDVIYREIDHVDDLADMISLYTNTVLVRHIPYTGNWKKDRQNTLSKDLAEKTWVSILNLCSCLYNPTQALGDIVTLLSYYENLKNKKCAICWMHDPDFHPMATANSFAMAATRFGMGVTVASPKSFQLDNAILRLADNNAQRFGGDLKVTHSLKEALEDAEIVYALPWRSIEYYNDPKKEIEEKKKLQDWVLTPELLEKENIKHILHTFPIRRNISIPSEIVDSSKFRVYEQSKNLVYVQKAIISNLHSIVDKLRLLNSLSK